MRNATKKASAAGVAPNNRASTISRIKPRMRLENVAMPITPADFTTEWISSCLACREEAGAVGSGMDWILAEQRRVVY